MIIMMKQADRARVKQRHITSMGLVLLCYAATERRSPTNTTLLHHYHHHQYYTNESILFELSFVVVGSLYFAVFVFLFWSLLVAFSFLLFLLVVVIGL